MLYFSHSFLTHNLAVFSPIFTVIILLLFKACNFFSMHKSVLEMVKVFYVSTKAFRFAALHLGMDAVAQGDKAVLVRY